MKPVIQAEGKIGTLVDVGCGIGAQAKYLDGSFEEYIGIDYSSNLIGIGEEMFKVYSDLFGVETVCFRYFNVYGDRQPLKGQYAPVVGLFMEMNKHGESMSVVVDGLQRRDFTHVSDVVEANILAATTSNKDVLIHL